MINSPLIYLTLRSARNRIYVRLRRLREPRYLVATLLGVTYLAFVFAGQATRGDAPGMFRAVARGREILEVGATLLLFAGLALAWFWPGAGRPALAFSRAEVQHLFTAPIERPRLLRYRVLRSLTGALVGSAITALLLRPPSLAHMLAVCAALTVAMVTFHLHLMAVSLSRASGGAARRVPRAVVTVAVAIVGATLAIHWTELTTMDARGGSVAAELGRLTTSGATGVVLWPFRAIIRPVLADSSFALMTSLPWALTILALNYVWVVRTDVPFEEASAELSEKLDALRRRGPDALRQPRPTKTPFRLAAHGRPETAILWKNLISMGRGLSWTMLARVAPFCIFLAVVLSTGRRETASILTFACLFGAAFTLLLGPHIARSDLRQDLAALAVLKTWPIRGATVVRGEILAPAIVLTAIASLALVTAAVMSTRVVTGVTIVDRWSWLVAALLVAPGFVLTQLLAHNALAVTFPSWVAIGARQHGLDVFGQRLLVMMAVVLGLAVAVLPPAIVAAIGAGILYALTGAVWPVVPAALAGATLLLEVFAGSEIIGAILDRTDITAVDAPES